MDFHRFIDLCIHYYSSTQNKCPFSFSSSPGSFPTHIHPAHFTGFDSSSLGLQDVLPIELWRDVCQTWTCAVACCWTWFTCCCCWERRNLLLQFYCRTWPAAITTPSDANIWLGLRKALWEKPVESALWAWALHGSLVDLVLKYCTPRAICTSLVHGWLRILGEGLGREMSGLGIFCTAWVL